MIACYSRVSTQEQALNGHSIDEQNDRMQKYCAAMGWKPCKVYTDAGFSGANTNRPTLQKLIRDVKAGKIEKVLVYKLDRLSRSQRDTLYLIEDVFLANGCEFVSMSENFDTSSPFGRAMIGILAVFAQLEREQIKERMAMGKEARAKDGKFGGGKIPIGYDYEDGQLVINDFEQIQIKEVFEQYAAGISPKKIAENLNNAGYSHKYGNWYHKTIREILDKKTYIGCITHQGKWRKGTHDPIIDNELFEKCQSIKQRKAKMHDANRREGRVKSYLGGLLFCAHCGAKYSKDCKYRKGKKFKYYYCNSRSKRVESLIRDPNCKNKIWRMDDLDEIVLNEIRKLSLDPDALSVIETDQDDRTEIISKKLSDLENRISKLMDLFSVNFLPLEVLQEKITALNEQRAKLQNELDEIERSRSERITREDAANIINSFGDILDNGDFEQIHAVVIALIDRIDLDGENITIHWSFT